MLSFIAKPENADKVVYTTDTLANLVAIYTRNDVYFARNSNVCCLMNTDRLRDMYFFELWLEGVNADQAAQTFLRAGRTRSARLYGIHFRETQGENDDICDEVLQTLASEYRTYLQFPTDKKLSLYPLDLMVAACHYTSECCS